jgi:biopolymer transport protein ExbD
MMEINTTPLIDVMLVLLVMLIITIPIQLHAVKMETPKPVPSAVKLPEAIRIDIGPDDRIRWQGRLLVDEAELHGLLEAAKADSVAASANSLTLQIRPDVASHYDTFVRVMIAARQRGLDRLAVVNTP